jgi:hypothetical protein
MNILFLFSIDIATMVATLLISGAYGYSHLHINHVIFPILFPHV